MMIYEPKGKAREYSPRALNVYLSCDHGCKYCYARSMWRSDIVTPRSGIEMQIENEHSDCQVLLSFLSDPYCKADEQQKITRTVLKKMLSNNIPVALLTKGGLRSLRDLDIISQFKRKKIGATLTFLSADKSKECEPGAALPSERIEALRQFKQAGITTWASMEPVLDPDESLELIRTTLRVVDHYKIGKLNHTASKTDWKSFCRDACKILRDDGKQFYVKNDLAAFLPADFFTPDERNPDLLCV